MFTSINAKSITKIFLNKGTSFVFYAQRITQYLRAASRWSDSGLLGKTLSELLFLSRIRCQSPFRHPECRTPAKRMPSLWSRVWSSPWSQPRLNASSALRFKWTLASRGPITLYLLHWHTTHFGPLLLHLTHRFLSMRNKDADDDSLRKAGELMSKTRQKDVWGEENKSYAGNVYKLLYMIQFIECFSRMFVFTLRT